MEKEEKNLWSNSCLNPLGKKSHKKNVSLRFISEILCSKFPTIPKHSKLCDSCRKELNKLEELPSKNDNIDNDIDNDNFEMEEFIPDSNVDSNSDSENSIVTETGCRDKYHLAGVEVLNQIKEKFASSTSKIEKFQLLTLAPQSWTGIELMNEFGISERQARNVKSLVKEQGILSCPSVKKGRSLNPETENLATAFYDSDEVSRLMPGMKDYVSVKINDSKIHVQKRLILCNLNELYSIFKTQNPDVKLGFSKFAQLRPKHCVIAGSSGTHTVCVCVYHENLKLMLRKIKLEYLTENTNLKLIDFRDCLKLTMCPDAKTPVTLENVLIVLE